MLSNGSSSIKAGILFIVPSAAALLILIFFVHNWNVYKAEAVSVKGVITQVHKKTSGKHYNVSGRNSYIEGVYTVDGVEYTVRTDYDGFFRKKQKVTYYYPEGFPEGGRLMPVGSFAAAGLAALFFGAIGVIGLISGIRERNEYKKLIVDYAEISFDEWEEADDLNAGGNSRMKCCVFRYDDPSGEIFEFHSESYAEGKCPFKKGLPVTVYVDTDDPKKYYISQKGKKRK